jgi:hypothetical protein
MIFENYLNFEIKDNYDLVIEGRVIKPKIRWKRDMLPVLLYPDEKDRHYLY